MAICVVQQSREGPRSSRHRVLQCPPRDAGKLGANRMPYEAIPIDTSKSEQRAPSSQPINPNGKAPVIVKSATRVGNLPLQQPTSLRRCERAPLADPAVAYRPPPDPEHIAAGLDLAPP